MRDFWKQLWRRVRETVREFLWSSLAGRVRPV